MLPRGEGLQLAQTAILKGARALGIVSKASKISSVLSAGVEKVALYGDDWVGVALNFAFAKDAGREWISSTTVWIPL